MTSRFYAMFHKPLTWVLCTLLSLCSLALTVYYFNKAYSIVSVHITMNRAQAQKAAAEIANKYNLGPKDYYHAVQFHLDEDVQNYVELEAGGKQTFENMLDENLYEPYTWQVRHFVPQDPHELIVKFTPEGLPYGFTETLSETASGASLDEHAARKLAETAAQNWSIHIATYTLLASCKEIREGGRTDHTFTYERPDVIVKDARYRLTLVVSGDKLTSLEHSLHIPESFGIRYAQMRSANEGINTASEIFIWAVYLFLFGLVGIFLLLRSGFVIFTPAVRWGIGLAFLQIASLVNGIPLVLFSYPTQLSLISFFGLVGASVLQQFVKSVFMITVSIIAAESLTRKAFGDHIQFWRSWSPRVASSSTMIGETLGAYLYVPLFLVHSTGLYFIGTTFLGWWQPSYTLVDPNILASYFPWFTPLASALGAGFWEECLFRAIPLATAALIGRRFKKERLFVIIALIVQALVFGAGHANYPQQPSYFRVIELFLPSLGFGWLYLAFGLVPAIIVHFVYDVVWMALPLIISTAPGNWLNQLLIVVLSLIPVWILIIQGLRSKSRFLHPASAQDKNSAWQPSPELLHEEQFIATHLPLAKKARYNILAFGILCIGILFFILPHQQDIPYITMTRDQALIHAQNELARRNIVLDDTWQTFAAICSPEHTLAYIPSSVLCPPLDDYDFVWQIGGKELYHHLLGTYLSTPCWFVRYASFEGNVEKKSTEYRMLIDTTGKIQRFQQKMAETQAGHTLEEQEARALAHHALQTQLGIDPATLTELSDSAQQRPARRDWGFIFFDPKEDQLPGKAPRIAVSIADGLVVDVYRYIDIPEEWERAESERASIINAAKFISKFLLYAFFIIAGTLALLALARKRLSLLPFLVIFGGWLILMLLQLFNNWPIIIGLFKTSKPFIAQSFSIFATTFFSDKIIGAAIAGLFGCYLLQHRQRPITSILWHVVLGVSCGISYFTLVWILNYLEPSLSPLIATSDILATRFPWLGFAAHQIIQLNITILAIGMFCAILDQLFHKKRYLTGFALILFSGFLYAPIPALPLYWWILESLAVSLFFAGVYWLLLARDRSYLALILGSYTALNMLLSTWLNPVPGAVAYLLVASIAIIATAALWLFLLQKREA